MKPTDEQIKALRKGDVVTVRAEVEHPLGPNGLVRITIWKNSMDGTVAYTTPSEIVSIEPRRVRVGDSVSCAGYKGIVRYVEGDRACISSGLDGLFVANIQTLEVIP